MIKDYFNNLSDFLASLRAPETHTATFILLDSMQPELQAVLREVVCEEGYGTEDVMPPRNGYCDFLVEFVVEQPEAIEKAQQRWKIKKNEFDNFFRLVAQRYWADHLYTDISVLEVVCKGILDDQTNIKPLIFNKLKLVFPELYYEQTDDYFHRGLEKLLNQVAKNSYQGGNLKKYLVELVYNIARDDRKKSERRDSYTKERRKKDMGLADNTTPDLIMQRNESAQLLKQLFRSLTRRCQQVLISMRRLGTIPRKVIAEELGYKSVQSYSNKLDHCQKKIDQLWASKHPDYE